MYWNEHRYDGGKTTTPYLAHGTCHYRSGVCGENGGPKEIPGNPGDHYLVYHDTTGGGFDSSGYAFGFTQLTKDQLSKVLNLKSKGTQGGEYLA